MSKIKFSLTNEEISLAEDYTKVDIEKLRYLIMARINTARRYLKRRSRNNQIRKLDADEIIRLFNLLEWKCVYCGIDVDVNSIGDDDPYHLSIDHCLPLSKDGEHGIANIVCACKYCNNDKDLDNIDDFLVRRGIDVRNFHANIMKVRLKYSIMTSNR